MLITINIYSNSYYNWTNMTVHDTGQLSKLRIEKNKMKNVKNKELN